MPSSFSLAAIRLENGVYIVENCEGVADIDGTSKSQKNTAREKAKSAACSYALEKIFSEFVNTVKYSSPPSKNTKNFTITKEFIQDKKFHVIGVCKFDEKTINKLIAPLIIKTLNSPKILLIVNEKVGGKVQSNLITHKIIKNVLEKNGYSVVTPDMATPVTNPEAFKNLSSTEKLYDLARTLRADVIIIVNATQQHLPLKKFMERRFTVSAVLYNSKL